MESPSDTRSLRRSAIPSLIALVVCVGAVEAFIRLADLRPFDFGGDSELTESQVTPQRLQQIIALTGLRLPNGAACLAYSYLGSGIDDALAEGFELLG